MNTRILLKRNYFTEKEKLFLEMEDIRVSQFQFETGIDALRIENALGYIIVLPFKGQMIWEAVFGGRPLNMYRVDKREPKPGDFYLNAAFGSYFFHCGALRMGCPTEEDDHPLHGELPYADYDEAELIVGEDEKGKYVGIGGVFRYNRGFGPCYEAHPLTKVYSKSSLMDISIRIENHSSYPMELMYLAHLNSRPVDHARLVQCNAWTPEAMPFRDPEKIYVPGADVASGLSGQVRKYEKNPELSQVMEPDEEFRPEIGFYLDDPKTDAEGWTRVMQVLPDGTADVIRYKPSELNHAMRWLCKTADQAGMSLAFPGTANVEGYTEEKRSGRVRDLPPKGHFCAAFTVGCLNKEDAAKEEAIIRDIMAKG